MHTAEHIVIVTINTRFSFCLDFVYMAFCSSFGDDGGCFASSSPAGPPQTPVLW